MNTELYNSLATLLSYPDEQLLNVCHAGGGDESAVALELAQFSDKTRALDLRALQELFIQTFDLSPVCSLEMGWHLFGENYDRGLLLVKIRQLLRACGVAEATELPDHITYALRLIPRMNASEAEYFVEAVVLSALGKMIAALEGKDNPYQHVLLAVRSLLRADFPDIAMTSAGAELRVLA
jgi:nitrate reductase assembly molybdenum cofactor insertion protein NarJ